MSSDTGFPPQFRRRCSAQQAERLAAGWFRRSLGAGAALLRELTLALSAQSTSFQAVARRGERLPSPSLLGEQWREWRHSQSLDEWEAGLDAALRAPWRACLRGEAVWFVADWHTVPYWGRVAGELEGEVRRGPPDGGTTHFLVYATVAVLWRGVRIHVVCTRVRKGDSQADVFARLFARASELGCRPLGWIMDKGFYCAGVVASLREGEHPYLIAAPRRGKKEGIASLLEAAEQEDGFQDLKPPPRVQAYKLSALDREVGPQPTQVIISWEPVTGDPLKRRQRTLRRSLVKPGQQWRAVAWIGGGRKWTGKKAQRAYAPRTGFESGYRMEEATRGRTSSRDPRWRLILFGLSLLLQNTWAWLLTEGKRTLKRCWRNLREALPFIDFCAWIVRVLERKAGHRLAVDLPGV